MQSLLLGAILASTDPVVLRDVVRDDAYPRSVRRALSVEAGMNDIVVLPIVLILIALLRAEVGGAARLAALPGAAAAAEPAGRHAGRRGRRLADGPRRRTLGHPPRVPGALRHRAGAGAYAAGQAVQGDGFLAAFFAGLAVTLFNVSLCDCFLDMARSPPRWPCCWRSCCLARCFRHCSARWRSCRHWCWRVVVIVVARPLALGLVLRRAP